ncbi:peptidase C45 [Bacillaceae bacterium JMAK1]|nr:peptidase C45 [Bacillaceae bacterium JMAK1]
MTEPFEVDVSQFRGSSYDIGFHSGQQVKGKKIVDVFENVTRDQIDVDEMKTLYKTYAPHLLDEMEGISEALQLPFAKVAACFSGYDIPKVEAMGCSTMMLDSYYVRNYDFAPELYDHRFALSDPKEAFATAGYPLQLLGRHDGVNEHGLVAGFHFVSNTDYKTGISAWTAVRMVLDTCRSTEDAIELLQAIPHAACYNFSIADAFGKQVAVEATPTTVNVRYSTNALACVNHFQTETLQSANRTNIEGSKKRNDYIQKLLEQNVSFEDAVRLFSVEDSPLFYTDYDELFGTLHTFAYEFTTSRVVTCPAGRIDILDFIFTDWVNGENLRTNRLLGER